MNSLEAEVVYYNKSYMADRPLSPEEEQIAKQASIAEFKTKIAEAELKLAQARQGLRNAVNPPAPSAKDIAETNAAIAQADQKRLQAEKDNFKGPDVKSLEGKITSDGTFIESRILAAASLNKAFDKLLNAIKCDKNFKDGAAVTFIMYNAADFGSIELYHSIQAQIATLSDNFTKNIGIANHILQPPAADPQLAGGAFPVLASFAIAGALRSVIDIVSLFRTNTNFSNFDMPVDDVSLIASFTHAVHHVKKEWKVFAPATYPIGLLSPSTAATSNLIKALEELRALSNKIDDLGKAFDNQLISLQQDLLIATPEAAKKAVQNKIELLSFAKDSLQQLVPIYSQLEKTLASVDATTNISMQAVLLRAERFVERLAKEHTYIIKLSVTSRGSNRVTDNLFLPSRITHSGGTQLSCIIFSPGGEIIFSHNTHHYIKYKKPDVIS